MKKEEGYNKVSTIFKLVSNCNNIDLVINSREDKVFYTLKTFSNKNYKLVMSIEEGYFEESEIEYRLHYSGRTRTLNFSDFLNEIRKLDRENTNNKI